MARSVEEKVNKTVGGAPSKKPSDGSGMKKGEMSGGGHDSLVSLGENMTNPYNAKASDFSVTAASLGPHGQAEGENVLVPQSEYQESPRCVESEDGMGEHGAGTPAEWGKGGKAFKVSVNGGEGANPGQESSRNSVDLVTGRIEGEGQQNAHVKGVKDPAVRLG